MSVGTALTARTTQDLIIKTTQTQRNNITKLQQNAASEVKYRTTAEMSDTVRNKFIELGRSASRVTQLQSNASQFLAKIGEAMGSVQNMQDKISSSLPGLLAEYPTITAEGKTLLTGEITNILQTMQVEMNSSFSGGGYLFASSNNNNSTPIGDIVNVTNYGPDNLPNTNYVNNPSISDKITVADGTSFNTDINPGDPAFRDTIAALHMMLDALNANSTTIPPEALALFQTSQSEMRNFLASNLQPLYENTERAIEKNDNTLDNIEAQIESEFKANPVETSAMIANTKSLIEFNLGIVNSMNDTPRLWDILFK